MNATTAQAVERRSHTRKLTQLAQPCARTVPANGRPPLAVERIVFGSHAPFFPCESAVFKLFESPLGRPELEKVMRGNAERFLKG